MTDAEEMIELMRYASNAKVAAALRVSKSATGAWARGKNVTPYRLNQVRQLLRPQTASEAPAWIERLLAAVMVLEHKAGVSDAERDRAAALAAAWLATAAPSAQRQPGVGGAGAAPDA